MKVVCLVFAIHFASSFVNSVEIKEFKSDENVCVPLPQCKSLNWMWRHRTEIPNETSENVENFITSLKCGLPLDVCPQAKKIITRDRNPLVKGLRRNQGSFIRNPVKKLGYQKLVDYGCKPFLKLHLYTFRFLSVSVALLEWISW